MFTKDEQQVSPSTRDIAMRSAREVHGGRRRRLFCRTSTRSRRPAGGRRRSSRQGPASPMSVRPGRRDSSPGRSGRQQPAARIPRRRGSQGARTSIERGLEERSPGRATIVVRHDVAGAKRQALRVLEDSAAPARRRSERSSRIRRHTIRREQGIRAAGKMPSPRLASVIGQRPTVAPLRAMRSSSR